MALSDQLRSMILKFQENEITEHHIYANLARKIRDPENQRILQHIAEPLGEGLADAGERLAPAGHAEVGGRVAVGVADTSIVGAPTPVRRRRDLPDLRGAQGARTAVAAEAAGFESLITVEHVVWPQDYVSTYPYAPTGRLPGGPSPRTAQVGRHGRRRSAPPPVSVTAL